MEGRKMTLLLKKTSDFLHLLRPACPLSGGLNRTVDCCGVCPFGGGRGQPMTSLGMKPAMPMQAWLTKSLSAFWSSKYLQPLETTCRTQWPCVVLSVVKQEGRFVISRPKLQCRKARGGCSWKPMTYYTMSAWNQISEYENSNLAALYWVANYTTPE